MNNHKIRINILVITWMLLATLVGCSFKFTSSVIGGNQEDIGETSSGIELMETGIDGNLIKVHFISIGQGDATLIESVNGQFILIDTGKEMNYEILATYIDALGIEYFDYLVGTHPDEDHIGSIERIIEDYKVGALMMPDVSVDTASFYYVMEAIENYGIPLIHPGVGDRFELDGMNFEVMGPVRDNYEEINDYSLVIRMDYDDASFLFTGDAESVSEHEMVENNARLNVDVLKVGHHGSYNATSTEFLVEIQPMISIISCGLDNNYGYPHDQVLKRLAVSGNDNTVLRTDLDGDIVILTDGEQYEIQCSTDNQETLRGYQAIRIETIDQYAEYALVVNEGDSNMDISGWELYSERGYQSITIPEGVILEPGGEYIIGNDESIEVDLIWTGDKGAGIWSNTNQDDGMLYDYYGNLIDIFLDQ